MMIGIGTPRSHKRIPRPISLSSDWYLRERSLNAVESSA
jgi:hypothetical protein